MYKVIEPTTTKGHLTSTQVVYAQFALGGEPRASNMQGTCSAAEPQPQPIFHIL